MKRWLLSAGMLLAGASLQANADSANAFQMSPVNGQQIAWQCRGEGPKTVLLLAGMGLDVQSTYKNIYRNFAAKGYQICMYDRAGSGQSSPLQAPRPMSALVDELDSLIKDRHWDKPVLVAHSFGGLLARAYLFSHPHGASGLVYADCAHERWYGSLKSALSPDGWAIMENIFKWEKFTHSHEDFEEAVQFLDAHAQPIKVPVTVLSRGLPHNTIRQARMSYSDVDAYNATWDAAQTQFLNDAPDARHVRMHYSSHFVDEQDPWLVIEEIQALLKRVEAKQS
ncbi:alpha/beta hydrolase [Burkholderiaceae bacterium DAT-1]|nr:alpha/beta hydrolase [Burkholderiaceae bacterium DAT-1]